MGDLLAEHDVAWIRAGNPGAFTLDGSNTWVLGREPAFVVETAPGIMKMSFRSEGIDVNRLAQTWGGGGHRHDAKVSALPHLCPPAKGCISAGQRYGFKSRWDYQENIA